MYTILDFGKRGAESADIIAPTPSAILSGMQRFAATVDRFPASKLDVDTSSGTKRNIEVHSLQLHNPKVFGLIWEMALYEPFVYAHSQGRKVMGVLSPNFDETGSEWSPSIKVLPLRNPYPLVASGTNLLPDARTATMLAGSARAEGQGSGSHDKPPSQDYEHKLTYIGALSLGKNTIVQNGSHVQHSFRARSSVATGLTDGSLGNIYSAGGNATAGFDGYALPLLFTPGATKPDDTIYIPKGFLHNEEAYGLHYADAARIAYGASLQIMYDRLGRQAASDNLAKIADRA